MQPTASTPLPGLKARPFVPVVQARGYDRWRGTLEHLCSVRADDPERPVATELQDALQAHLRGTVQLYLMDEAPPLLQFPDTADAPVAPPQRAPAPAPSTASAAGSAGSSDAGDDGDGDDEDKPEAKVHGYGYVPPPDKDRDGNPVPAAIIGELVTAVLEGKPRVDTDEQWRRALAAFTRRLPASRRVTHVLKSLAAKLRFHLANPRHGMEEESEMAPPGAVGAGAGAGSSGCTTSPAVAADGDALGRVVVLDKAAIRVGERDSVLSQGGVDAPSLASDTVFEDDDGDGDVVDTGTPAGDARGFAAVTESASRAVTRLLTDVYAIACDPAFHGAVVRHTLPAVAACLHVPWLRSGAVRAALLVLAAVGSQAAAAGVMQQLLCSGGVAGVDADAHPLGMRNAHESAPAADAPLLTAARALSTFTVPVADAALTGDTAGDGDVLRSTLPSYAEPKAVVPTPPPCVWPAVDHGVALLLAAQLSYGRGRRVVASVGVPHLLSTLANPTHASPTVTHAALTVLCHVIAAQPALCVAHLGGVAAFPMPAGPTHALSPFGSSVVGSGDASTAALTEDGDDAVVQQQLPPPPARVRVAPGMATGLEAVANLWASGHPGTRTGAAYLLGCFTALAGRDTAALSGLGSAAVIHGSHMLALWGVGLLRPAQHLTALLQYDVARAAHREAVAHQKVAEAARAKVSLKRNVAKARNLLKASVLSSMRSMRSVVSAAAAKAKAAAAEEEAKNEAPLPELRPPKVPVPVAGVRSRHHRVALPFALVALWGCCRWLASAADEELVVDPRWALPPHSVPSPVTVGDMVVRTMHAVRVLLTFLRAPDELSAVFGAVGELVACKGAAATFADDGTLQVLLTRARECAVGGRAHHAAVSLVMRLSTLLHTHARREAMWDTHGGCRLVLDAARALPDLLLATGPDATRRAAMVHLQSLTAATLMSMCDVGGELGDDDVKAVVALLQSRELDVVRYATYAVWGVCKVESNRPAAVAAGVVTQLGMWNRLLLSAAVARDNGWDAMDGVPDQVLTWDEHTMAKLHEQVLGALWLISTCDEGAAAVANDPNVGSIIEVMKLQYKWIQDAQYLVVGVVHSAARSGDMSAVDRFIEQETPTQLHGLVTASTRLNANFRLTALRCLLLLYALRPASVNAQLSAEFGPSPVANLVLQLLFEPSQLIQRHVVAVLASLSSHTEHRDAIATPRNVARLLHLLTTSADTDIMLGSLLSLLNVTTTPSGQQVVGRTAIPALYELFRNATLPHAALLAADTLLNLSHHADNRTRLYKAELFYKALDQRLVAGTHTPADVAYLEQRGLPVPRHVDDPPTPPPTAPVDSSDSASDDAPLQCRPPPPKLSRTERVARSQARYHTWFDALDGMAAATTSSPSRLPPVSWSPAATDAAMQEFTPATVRFPTGAERSGGAAATLPSRGKQLAPLSVGLCESMAAQVSRMAAHLDAAADPVTPASSAAPSPRAGAGGDDDGDDDDDDDDNGRNTGVGMAWTIANMHLAATHPGLNITATRVESPASPTATGAAKDSFRWALTSPTAAGTTTLADLTSPLSQPTPGRPPPQPLVSGAGNDLDAMRTSMARKRTAQRRRRRRRGKPVSSSVSRRPPRILSPTLAHSHTAAETLPVMDVASPPTSPSASAGGGRGGADADGDSPATLAPLKLLAAARQRVADVTTYLMPVASPDAHTAPASPSAASGGGLLSPAQRHPVTATRFVREANPKLPADRVWVRAELSRVVPVQVPPPSPIVVSPKPLSPAAGAKPPAASLRRRDRAALPRAHSAHALPLSQRRPATAWWNHAGNAWDPNIRGFVYAPGESVALDPALRSGAVPPGEAADVTVVDFGAGATLRSPSPHRVDSSGGGGDDGDDDDTDAAAVTAPPSKLSFTVYAGLGTDRQRVQFGGSVTTADLAKRITAGPPPPRSVHMAAFPHVPGCTVCLDLFPHVRTPDGHTCHFFMRDTVRERAFEVLTTAPVVNPVNLSDIRQVSFPAMPLPVVPVPVVDLGPSWATACARLLPLPPLPSPKAYTRWPVSVHLCVTHTPFEHDDPPDTGVKEPFDLSKSVWAARAKTTEGKDFYNTPAVRRKAFARDWQRILKKSRFMKFLALPGVNANTPEATEAVCQVLQRNYGTISLAFDYFSSKSSNITMPVAMDKLAYLDFVSELEVVGETTVTQRDVEMAFMLANWEEAAVSVTEDSINPDHALLLFEFMEVVIRLSAAKFLLHASAPAQDLPQALQFFTDVYITPGLFGAHATSHDSYRRNRMYSQAVNDVLVKYVPRLKKVYNRFSRLYGRSQRKRLRRVGLLDWLSMMRTADMLNDDFTLREAFLSCTWSIMKVSDPVNRSEEAYAMSFEDFLEALCRACDLLSVPTDDDIARLRVSSAAEWDAAVSPDERLRCRRASVGWFGVTTRHLPEKLDKYIEMLLARLKPHGRS